LGDPKKMIGAMVRYLRAGINPRLNPKGFTTSGRGGLYARPDLVLVNEHRSHGEKTSVFIPNPDKPVGVKRKSRFIGARIATKAPRHKARPLDNILFFGSLCLGGENI